MQQDQTLLEIKLMELMRHVEELDEVISTQAKTIDQLRSKLEALETTVGGLEPALTGQATFGNEAPPHY